MIETSPHVDTSKPHNPEAPLPTPNEPKVEVYYRQMHRRYSVVLLAFTMVVSLIYLCMISNNLNAYTAECAQCQTTLYTSLYIYCLFCVALAYVHLKNFKVDIYEIKAIILVTGSLKYIYGLFWSLILIIACFIAQEWLYCSRNLLWASIWVFLCQIFQIMGQFLIMMFYYYRVYIEIEHINENKAGHHVKPSIEIFNASTIVKETTSEAGLKETNQPQENIPKMDMNCSQANSSQFTISYGDRTKIMSIYSADSIFNISKLPDERTTQRIKRHNFNRNIHKI